MLILFTIIFLVIDIVSKLLISNLMNVGQSIQIINDFFNITYVRNTGAAWSILSGETWLLIIVSLIIISLIVFYIYKNSPKSDLEKISYSMILGGAIGNLLDRIIYGYVVDFLDFNVFGYDYPIFNLADSFILIGVILLVVYTWRCKDGNQSNRK
ncbi:MAG: signal peptidase II [Bacilli bacterium]|nr:signal peptidase II [Bacilli bacterium]